MNTWDSMLHHVLQSKLPNIFKEHIIHNMYNKYNMCPHRVDKYDRTILFYMVLYGYHEYALYKYLFDKECDRNYISKDMSHCKYMTILDCLYSKICVSSDASNNTKKKIKKLISDLEFNQCLVCKDINYYQSVINL
jgi:tRNA uridine 5-carbamoylmethylation protein Kti12